jgi:hypothetical protein
MTASRCHFDRSADMVLAFTSEKPQFLANFTRY